MSWAYYASPKYSSFSISRTQLVLTTSFACSRSVKDEIPLDDENYARQLDASDDSFTLRLTSSNSVDYEARIDGSEVCVGCYAVVNFPQAAARDDGAELDSGSQQRSGSPSGGGTTNRAADDNECGSNSHITQVTDKVFQVMGHSNRSSTEYNAVKNFLRYDSDFADGACLSFPSIIQGALDRITDGSYFERRLRSYAVVYMTGTGIDELQFLRNFSYGEEHGEQLFTALEELPNAYTYIKVGAFTRNRLQSIATEFQQNRLYALDDNLSNLFCLFSESSTEDGSDPNYLAYLPDAVTNSVNYVEWQELAAFRAGQVNEVVTRLQQLGKGSYVQYVDDVAIDDGLRYGFSTNVDYYGLKIILFPIDPFTGQRQSPEQFFNELRINWVEPQVAGPNSICSDDSYFTYRQLSVDQPKWTSTSKSNIVGSAFDIFINVPGPVNIDATVVTSDYQYFVGSFGSDLGWAFTTIYDNGPNYNGYHPVSGNREFGLEQTGGDYYLYTRGVDRYTNFYHTYSELIPNQSGYDQAQQLWECVYGNAFRNYVESRGGVVASQLTVEQYEVELLDLLDDIQSSNTPNDIICN